MPNQDIIPTIDRIDKIEESRFREKQITLASYIVLLVLFAVTLFLLWNVSIGVRFSYLTLIVALLLAVVVLWMLFRIQAISYHTSFFLLVFLGLFLSVLIAILLHVSNIFGATMTGFFAGDNPYAKVQLGSIVETVEFAPTNFSIGDGGTAVAVLSNQSPDTVLCGKVNLWFPHGFLDGFSIVYPTSPEHSIVKLPQWGDSRALIEFKDVELEPGQTKEIHVNVAAIESGNYGGNMQIVCFAKIGLGTFERVYGKTPVNVSVTP